nr:hypothetical protein [Tanacetum cinerariifolium]
MEVNLKMGMVFALGGCQTQRKRGEDDSDFFNDITALKPNQPEEPPFTDHMLAICAVDKPVVFKAFKTSSKAESVSQGTKPGAQTRHKKLLTSSKQPFMSSKKETKGVTSEAKANPQLSSGMSAFNLIEPIYSASFIIPSESALGNDASTASTTVVDLENSAPSDFVPQHHAYHKKRASSVSIQIEEETSSIIKLEDLAKLVSHVQPSFKDLDSPKDDPVIVVNDSDEDEDDEVYATKNIEIEDTSVAKSLSPRLLRSVFGEMIREMENGSGVVVVSFVTAYFLVLWIKFNDLTEEIKGLKNQVHNLKIKLPGYLKEIPPKLKDFTQTVTSLTSQVAELKTLQ